MPEYSPCSGCPRDGVDCWCRRPNGFYADTRTARLRGRAWWKAVGTGTCRRCGDPESETCSLSVFARVKVLVTLAYIAGRGGRCRTLLVRQMYPGSNGTLSTTWRRVSDRLRPSRCSSVGAAFGLIELRLVRDLSIAPAFRAAAETRCPAASSTSIRSMSNGIDVQLRRGTADWSSR